MLSESEHGHDGVALPTFLPFSDDLGVARGSYLRSFPGDQIACTDPDNRHHSRFRMNI